MGGFMKRGNGRGNAWVMATITYKGDECRLWPLSVDRDGYATFTHLGVRKYVHKYICEKVNGPRPTPKHQAAHSCGRGHDGCGTPRHLSWKTNAENQLDRKHHGTATTNPYGSASRRTPEQNEEIRRAVSTATVTAVAARFNVSRRTVERIRAGVKPRTPSQNPKNIRRRKFA